MKNGKIQKNFWMGEAVASDTAKRLKIDNTVMTEQVKFNICHSAYCMQMIRNKACESIGREVPIKIHSWYRSDPVNRAVGGHRRSWHKLGCAVDFSSNEVNLGDLFDMIHLMHENKEIAVDKLLYERRKSDGVSWLHIVFRMDAARGIFIRDYVV